MSEEVAFSWASCTPSVVEEWVGGCMSGIDMVDIVDEQLGELTSISASFHAAAVHLSILPRDKVFSERPWVMCYFELDVHVIRCFLFGLHVVRGIYSVRNCRGDILEQDLNSGSKEATVQSAALLVNEKALLECGCDVLAHCA